MATEDFKGMVLLDGVRYRKNDLERMFPDRVKDATPINDEPVAAMYEAVTTVPGGVVTGEDALGGKLVDTAETAAGNVPVPDTKHEGTGDGTGESGGSEAAAETAGKRSGSARTGASKGK